MRKISKLLVCFVTLIFSMGILFGCGGGPTVKPGPVVPGGEDTTIYPEFPTDPGVKETLKFYLWTSDGSYPDGFNDVLAEFNAKYSDKLGVGLEFKFDSMTDYPTKVNLGLSAGEIDGDILFDAAWMNLLDFSKKGYYYDLSADFALSSKNTGLKKAFSQSYINSNKFAGKTCAIPITESFGDIGVCFLRKDWRERCASDTSWVKNPSIGGTKTVADLKNGIDDQEEFMIYLYWVRDNKNTSWTVNGVKHEIPANTLPYAANKNGAYSPYDVVSASVKPPLKSQDFFDAGIKVDQQLVPGALFGTTYIKNGEVKAAALDYEKSDATHGKKDYPDGFNSTTSEWQDYFNETRKWKVDGIIDANVANENDPESKFKAGNAGVMMQTLSSFNAIEQSLKTNVPGAELEIFVHDKAMREKEKGTSATDFKAWNFLCVPKTTTESKKEKFITFMNWLYYKQENYDLFRYGIKGTHWKEAEDPDTGAIIPQTVTTVFENVKPYTFPSYLLAQNTNYVRSIYASDPKVLEYSTYAYSVDRLVPKLYVDFEFDTKRTPALETALKNPDLATEFSRLTSYKLGLVDNPIASWNAVIKNREENTNLQRDLDIIREELMSQLQAYIDKQ